MTYGLGDSDGAASVDVDSRELENGTAPVLYWGPAGPALYGDWLQYDASGHLILNGIEDITPATYTSGALNVVGGASFAKRLQIGSAEAGNISSNTGALRVAGGATFSKRTVAADGAIYAILADTAIALNSGDGTNAAQLCNGTYAVDATAGGINCNASAAFGHGGVPGATETTRTLRITLDDGSTLSCKLRGGILCAS
jgi:hypothetical protein